MINLANKSVLVTGGTGFIGSLLIESLLNENAKVTVLYRKYMYDKKIDNLLDSNRVILIDCDISKKENIDVISKDLFDIEYFFSLASCLKTDKNDYKSEIENSVNLNIKGIINLINCMPNLKKVCHASSMSVYGDVKVSPLDETGKINPTDCYGITKMAMDLFLKIYSCFTNVPSTVLRFSSVYGKGNTSFRAIPIFIEKALKNEDIIISGNGKNYRDYIYVTDAVSSMIKAMKSESTGIYNIGSGEKTTIESLVKQIIELTNSTSNVTFDNKKNDFGLVYNINKAKQDFDFSPQVSLREGLNKEIEWRKSI